MTYGELSIRGINAPSECSDPNIFYESVYDGHTGTLGWTRSDDLYLSKSSKLVGGSQMVDRLSCDRRSPSPASVFHHRVNHL